MTGGEIVLFLFQQQPPLKSEAAEPRPLMPRTCLGMLDRTLAGLRFHGGAAARRGTAGHIRDDGRLGHLSDVENAARVPQELAEKRALTIAITAGPPEVFRLL